MGTAKKKTVATRHRKPSGQRHYFLLPWVTLPLREWGTRFESKQRGGRRKAATAPPAKSRHTDPMTYLERITIHFAVLCVHVAEAVVPTQRGPFVAGGEAF